MSTLDKIKQLIKTQAEGHKGQVSEIEQLRIEEIEMPKITPEIKKQIQKCKNLEALSIVDCGLQSLDNLPICNLNAIDLSKNKITDSQLPKLAVYPNLIQILLIENNITKIEGIKALSKLSNLQEIQLVDNDVTSLENYQELIFKNLLNLIYLDGKDKDGNQIPEEEDFDDEDEEDDEEFDDDEDEDDEDASDQEDESPQPEKRR